MWQKCPHCTALSGKHFCVAHQCGADTPTTRRIGGETSALHPNRGQTRPHPTAALGTNVNNVPQRQHGGGMPALHSSVGQTHRLHKPAWGKQLRIAPWHGARTSTATVVRVWGMYLRIAPQFVVHTSTARRSVRQKRPHCALHLNVGQTLLHCRPVWGRHVNSTPHWGKNVRIALQGGRGAEAPTARLSASMG